MKKTIVSKTVQLLFLSAVCLSACQDHEAKESKEVATEMNEDKIDSHTGEKDASFVVDATSGSYDEVAIAEVALKNSVNEAVKELALQLKKDHSNIIDELKKTASAKSIEVPNNTSESIQKEIVELNEKKAKDFDKKWLSKVESMHDKSIKKYEDASANCADADIKTWAGNTLPKIRSHHDAINQLQEKIK